MTSTELDIKTLENWLWDAACKIRGEIDAPKYKDYILPLISLKRLSDVEPDILGMAYEYLLRKFAEGSGQSAGEFYTPREVAILMSYVLDPEPNKTIYDPCCGSGGLLIKCYLRFRAKYDANPSIAPLRSKGQEILHTTFAMAKMNAFIHDMETQIALGDTMHRPAFTNSDGSLRKFDIVTANPMWNQDFSQDTYENDPYNRFRFGYPPSSSADWGWIQHMFSSLNDGGKMAVVLDTGAVSRGSGNVGKNRERDIRQEFAFIVGIFSESELFRGHYISYQRFKSHRDAYGN